MRKQAVTRRWLTALVRALLAVLIVLAIAHIPVPQQTPRWVAYGEAPVLVFLLLCYLGKLLYDTLFYDHYHP
ncbi:MAG: hypothetical protein U0641_03995 [Anaerolineae bacterium]